MIDFRLPSGVSWLPLLPVLDEKLVAAIRGGGCTDLAFVARDAVRFLVSVPLPPYASSDARPPVSLSEAVDIRLGRLFWAIRAPKSDSVTPGPIDFLGCFTTVFALETGG